MKHAIMNSGWTRYVSFGLLVLLILALSVATVLAKVYGADFAREFVYGSPVFVALWGICAVTALWYLIVRSQQKKLAAFMLHLSFILILVGALVTHLFGLQGNLHLRQGEPETGIFVNQDWQAESFPFTVSLKEFHLEYYPGTFAPMDFVSTVVVRDGDRLSEGKVAMNHIYSYRNYRFYQSGYDVDGKGTTLSVSYDPYGISITYAGYALLLISMILFLCKKDSRFRQLLHHPLLRSAGVGCVLLFMAVGGLHAGELPRTLPKGVAAKLGNLYVYYNERLCPLQTLAKDFTTKLCGSPTYKGLTSEQVLSGWLFYYDDWKEEPVIRIKSKEVGRLLGIDGTHARLVDFVGADGYKLENGIASGSLKEMRAAEEATEKFNLVSMVATGSLLKIYPYSTSDLSAASASLSSPDMPFALDASTVSGKSVISETFSSSDKLAASLSSPDVSSAGMPSVVWYSFADDLLKDMPGDVVVFIHKSMEGMSDEIARKDYKVVNGLLDEIKKYQCKEACGVLPSDMRFKAEKIYNGMTYSRYLALLCVSLVILAFVFYCRRMILQKRGRNFVITLLLSLLVVVFLYLFATISLRGYVSGHLPFSNGYETMQFMAACAILLTFFLYKRFPAIIAFGYLVCGLSLLISMMGNPILRSPC